MAGESAAEERTPLTAPTTEKAPRFFQTSKGIVVATVAAVVMVMAVGVVAVKQGSGVGDRFSSPFVGLGQGQLGEPSFMPQDFAVNVRNQAKLLQVVQTSDLTRDVATVSITGDLVSEGMSDAMVHEAVKAIGEAHGIATEDMKMRGVFYVQRGHLLVNGKIQCLTDELNAFKKRIAEQAEIGEQTIQIRCGEVDDFKLNGLVMGLNREKKMAAAAMVPVEFYVKIGRYLFGTAQSLHENLQDKLKSPSFMQQLQEDGVDLDKIMSVSRPEIVSADILVDFPHGKLPPMKAGAAVALGASAAASTA